jgi:C-terminal processing protease CtpA/Prc
LREQRSPRTEVVAERHPLAGRAPGPLAGRAVFLVDGGCASACEMMLALARQIPGVIVAGQNTRGGMSVGEIALFRLPRSGITLSLGTRAFRDPLGDFSETRGFVPDVWIDTPDALDKAKRLARATFPDGIRRLDALASAVR